MTAEHAADDPAAVLAHLHQQHQGRIDFAFGAYSGQYYAIGVFGIRTASGPDALSALAADYAAAIQRWHAAPPPKAQPPAPRADLFTLPVWRTAAVR